MKSEYEIFMEKAKKITMFDVGTRIIDISGKVSLIKRHEGSITYVWTPEGGIDCYANCAKVIAFGEI